MGICDLVIRGQQGRVGHDAREELFYDAVCVAVRLFHAGRVVEVGVEKCLGGGAFGFNFRTEGDEPFRGAADLVKRGGSKGGDACADLVHQIGDERIEDTPEGFTDAEPGACAGIGADDEVVEAAEEGNAVADLIEGENAGVETIVEIGGEVSDFVGQVDELSFKRGPQIEKIFGQLGVRGRGVVARVLDDAFADGEGEVETAKGGVALFKPGDDAEGVQVVIEAETVRLQSAVEGFFAGVTERGVADVVGEGEGFGEVGVEAQSTGESAG